MRFSQAVALCDKDEDRCMLSEYGKIYRIKDGDLQEFSDLTFKWYNVTRLKGDYQLCPDPTKINLTFGKAATYVCDNPGMSARRPCWPKGKRMYADGDLAVTLHIVDRDGNQETIGYEDIVDVTDWEVFT